MAYCATQDLLLGQIPTPRGVDPEKYVTDAADEIDSHIGFIYETPVDVSDENTELPRPVKLLLKRINVALASGRLILAMASPSEQTSLHAYGASLVKSALDTLKSIEDGRIQLTGVEEIGGSSDTDHRGPMILNGDASSAVDDFYGQNGAMAPNFITGGRVNGQIPVEWESWPRGYPLEAG